MKTLEQCKDEVAISRNFKDWRDVEYFNPPSVYINTLLNDAAQLYADEFTRRFVEWLRQSDRFNSGQSMDMVITEYKATL